MKLVGAHIGDVDRPASVNDAFQRRSVARPTGAAPHDLGKIGMATAELGSTVKLTICVSDCANSASQMRVAFSNIVLKTGCRSPGELLMT